MYPSSARQAEGGLISYSNKLLPWQKKMSIMMKIVLKTFVFKHGSSLRRRSF
jgi:hypothetical protein